MSSDDVPEWLFRNARAKATSWGVEQGGTPSADWIAGPGEPPQWKATVEFKDPAVNRKWHVEIVMLLRNSRIEVTEVRLAERDGGRITAESMRELPWGSLLSDIRADVADQYRRSADLIRQDYLVNGHDELAAQENDRDKFANMFSEGRREITREKLELVAQIYRSAALEGKPTAAVAKALGMNRSTAAKYVSRARKLHLLSPTTQGKAGTESSPNGDAS